ncbi:MAG: DNA replication/repair protein RecF [Rickettsiaceae bacterium]|nr:DNA replication/repair protein RecF [Rickettsiaceae bacterium]
MQNCFLKSLVVANFRNLEHQKLEFGESNRILITGQNGAGKTSILEAISLLSPGRGMRGEKFDNIINTNSSSSTLIFNMQSYIGELQIRVDFTKGPSKKTTTLNDALIPSNELIKFSHIFWLTPQQNILFQEAVSTRRKFFDRIVYSFFSEHAGNLTKYEHYQKERLHLLTRNEQDGGWVDILEEKLASIGEEICKSRTSVLGSLNDMISQMQNSLPKISLELKGEMENIYSDNKNDVKEAFRERFKLGRVKDSVTHKTNFGALKTDFMARMTQKNLEASLCSTGEQQSCLISTLIAHTELFTTKEQKAPILLLDELFSHLDEKNKNILSNYLVSKSFQIFITSTEKELCGNFSKEALVIEL